MVKWFNEVKTNLSNLALFIVLIAYGLQLIKNTKQKGLTDGTKGLKSTN